MTAAKYGSLLVALFLITFFGYAFFNENGFEATGTYFSLLWSQATMLDVFAGLLIFYAWVYYREKSIWRMLPWAVAAILLGNITTAIYVFLALSGSGNDPQKFFFGKRA